MANRKGNRGKIPKPIADNVDPETRRVVELIDSSPFNGKQIAERAGVCRHQVSRWRLGQSRARPGAYDLIKETIKVLSSAS